MLTVLPRTLRVHSLTGRITLESLSKALKAGKRNRGGAGLDKQSLKMFEAHLDENLLALMRDMQSGTYQPLPLPRVSMPTGAGMFRPLGIPSVRCRVAQEGIRALSEPIFAPTFQDSSHGFRRRRSCHTALAQLVELHQQGFRVVVDADLKGFFDSLPHHLILALVAGEIADGNILSLITKFLQAGVMEEGEWRPTCQGTPQGGELSPVRAPVFLHYVLAVWVEQVGKQPCRGEACLIRDADECVCAFEEQADAERFAPVLGQRLEKGGLELSDTKTRLIPCSRYRRAGPPSGEFLGFAFRWGKDRQGQEHLKRRTARQKLRHALKRFTAWGKEPRHLRLPGLCKRLHAKRRGDDHDSGVHGNAARRKECFHSARRRLLKWLHRRSQRPSHTWQGYKEVLERFQVARPRIVGRPKTRQAALTT